MAPLLLVIVGVMVLLFLLRKESKKHDYLAEFNKSRTIKSVVSDQQVVDLKSLLEQSWQDKLSARWTNLKRQLGQYPEIKLVVVAIVLVVASVQLNKVFFRTDQSVISILTLIIGFVFLYRWLQAREQKMFDQAFPDALNMMTSAISSGESIMHSIIYVGKTLDGEVGKEFKTMGQRMQLGESIDDVFRKSCARFPYPSFYFFVICLRANIQRGGQLKDIMMRLNRMMFNARSVDKKKLSMTAEARMSVKIVAAIPFCFLFLLQYLSPENYEYVMFNPGGRPILYYVIISEAIGIGIVWFLMKGVR